MTGSPGEMPFLDHLEELRWRILRSLAAIVVCFGLGLWLVQHYQLVNLLKQPIAPYLTGAGGKLIVTSPTDDLRSYHVSSEKIKRELGWEPRYTVPDAIRELLVAFKAGKIQNSLSDPKYFNIKTMNAHLAVDKKAA